MQKIPFYNLKINDMEALAGSVKPPAWVVNYFNSPSGTFVVNVTDDAPENAVELLRNVLENYAIAEAAKIAEENAKAADFQADWAANLFDDLTFTEVDAKIDAIATDLAGVRKVLKLVVKALWYLINGRKTA